MNKVIIYIFIIFLKIIIYNSVYSQDTTKSKTEPVTKKDTAYIQNFILADHNYQYINKTSPDTLTRRRFLWYPAKSLEDIFNYVPGYYQYTMDVGQQNPLSFNLLFHDQTSILRNGIPINDPIDNKLDLNLLSRNEISEMEFSNGYSNNLYGYNNTINIITRELFQFRPYTEFSFFQDRYENLYFDGNFHQNFFRSLNFNFGITKHSYDGHYTNSDFDKWLGRFNLNFAPSNRLNFFLNVNYAKIQKGENRGIDPDKVNLGSKEDIFNSSADVLNSDAYSIKERFDINTGSVILAGKYSFTKIQLYVNNSFIKYRDEENRPNPNGILIKQNLHGINYGAKLTELIKINSVKYFKIISRTEADLTYKVVQNNFFSNEYSTSPRSIVKRYGILQNVNILYQNFDLSSFINSYTYDEFKSIKYHYGFNLDFKHKIDSLKQISAFVQYNQLNKYTSGGINLIIGDNSLNTEFFYLNRFYIYNTKPIRGLNSKLKLNLFKFDFESVYSFILNPEFPDVHGNSSVNIDYYPKHSGNLDLSWNDIAFKNKLEYKIGLTSRFWSKYYQWKVDKSQRIPANATLDFYIIGKIGKATFGLTFENILDRIIYNTGVYPFMDRGGFLNSMSRFNITWNFFD